MPLPALSEVPLPEPAALSSEQLRGAQCVFCPAPLSNAAAVDLGRRVIKVHGATVAWCPRSCPSCWKAQP